MDVGRRVADDDDVRPGNVDAELVARASLRDGGQLAAQLVIGAERADLESAEVDADGARASPSRPPTRLPVSSPTIDVVALVERVEQLVDPRHRLDLVGARRAAPRRGRPTYWSSSSGMLLSI